MTVEWFLRRKTIDGLDGTRITSITQRSHNFDEKKMAAGAFGYATYYG